MPNDSFDLKVRQLPGLAVLDLEGEINAAAEARLMEGYSQAERAQVQAILLNFKERRLHQQHRHRPHRQPVGPGPGGRTAAPGLRTQRSLR